MSYEVFCDSFFCAPDFTPACGVSFVVLCEKEILKKEKSLHRMQLGDANNQYSINEEVTEAVLQNKPMPDIAEKKMKDIMEVLGKLFNLAEQRHKERISTPHLFFQTRILMLHNLHLPLIEKIAGFQFHTADNYLYLYIVWKAALGEETVDIGKATEDIYDDPAKKVSYLQKILMGENALLKNNLVEVVEAKFFNDTELKLTDQSSHLLNDCF